MKRIYHFNYYVYTLIKNFMRKEKWLMKYHLFQF